MSANWSLDGVDLVELDRLAQRLALVLKPGDVIAVSGPLGAGKTSFARFLLARLGVGAARALSVPARVDQAGIDGPQLGGLDATGQGVYARAGAGAPIRVLAIGESTICGIGVARGVVTGFGLFGYYVALRGLKERR